MFDAADIVRRQSFVVDLRLYLPVPPAGVVLLSGQDHRGIRRRSRESVIAPMGREPAGDSRVIDLQDQQQSVLIIGANHHLRDLLAWLSFKVQGSKVQNGILTLNA